MPIRRILVIYKNSTYQHHFSGAGQPQGRAQVPSLFARRFKNTHDRHYQSLNHILALLKAHGLPFRAVPRGRKGVNSAQYDLIITVGGDGTFLEGARHATRQLILGVNSDPQWSVGRFCCADRDSFAAMLQRICAGQAPVRCLTRIALRMGTTALPLTAVNDLLICHRNPAAMSRYVLRLGRISEEHRSSGLWISTPAGASGAMRSAGGRRQGLTGQQLQYRARELYTGPGQRYALATGLLGPRQKIRLVSLMKEGMIYVDGSHVEIPFPFGQPLTVYRAAAPLRLVYP